MINIENVGKRLRMVREFFKFTQQKMSEVLPNGVVSQPSLHDTAPRGRKGGKGTGKIQF